eukprot:142800-Pelagomonas_calceolata.AAC.6
MGQCAQEVLHHQLAGKCVFRRLGCPGIWIQTNVSPSTRGCIRMIVYNPPCCAKCEIAYCKRTGCA